MPDTLNRPSDLSRIFDEFLVRRHLGESPILDEYCQRYPDLADQLRLHVHLYDALGDADSEMDVRGSIKDLYDPVAPARDAPKSAIDCVPADPRVLQLLDDLIDQEASSEVVFRSCPELLPEVRARWRQMSQTRAERDAMFPPEPAPEMGTVPRQENGVLPRITGYEVEAVLGQGESGLSSAPGTCVSAVPWRLKCCSPEGMPDQRNWRGSSARPKRSQACATRISSKSTKWGITSADRTSRWNWSMEAVLPRKSGPISHLSGGARN